MKSLCPFRLSFFLRCQYENNVRNSNKLQFEKKFGFRMFGIEMGVECIFPNQTNNISLSGVLLRGEQFLCAYKTKFHLSSSKYLNTYCLIHIRVLLIVKMKSPQVIEKGFKILRLTSQQITFKNIVATPRLPIAQFLGRMEWIPTSIQNLVKPILNESNAITGVVFIIRNINSQFLLSLLSG